MSEPCDCPTCRAGDDRVPAARRGGSRRRGATSVADGALPTVMVALEGGAAGGAGGGVAGHGLTAQNSDGAGGTGFSSRA